MKSTSELTDFYYKELYPSLQELERHRLELLSRMKWFGLLGTVLMILLILWLHKNFNFFHPFSIGTVVALFTLTGVMYRMMIRDYISDFKTKIITPLIHAIDSHLHYTPTAMVPKHLFTRSALFTKTPERYTGNDYVKGSIDGVALEFSDVHAEYRTKNSKGNTQWHTLFRGLFIVAEFNKHFSSRTLILPDLAEKTFGNLIGGWLQSFNMSRDNVIQLDDPEFEKKFVVYGNDPIEARYILTHAMMLRIVKLQKKLNYPIFISFVHNHLHIAIAAGKDLFEPTVWNSLLEYNKAMEYINTLRSTIGIIEELKLNEKLWSKA